MKPICSTDDEEIAAAAVSAGAHVFSLRPPHLSSDTAMAIDVLRYELDEARKRGEDPSHVVLLQPTSPFVRPSDIDDAVKLALCNSFDVVCTARDVGADHPAAMCASRVQYKLH